MLSYITYDDVVDNKNIQYYIAVSQPVKVLIETTRHFVINMMDSNELPELRGLWDDDGTIFIIK
jgi:hypothetical protein